MARDPLGGVGAWAGAEAEAGAWAWAGADNFRAQNVEKSRCLTLMCAKIATKRIVVNHSNVGGANMKD